MAGNRQITLRGVSVHNLKQVDLDIPHHKLIVICGVSGSGKSSLAFDTLYAEGQRRYIESFSAYTRQFLERLEKPEAERIEGIPPAIAVSQGSSKGSNRSTVGTATEINDYLRLLFARIGGVHCTSCGRAIRRDSPQSVADWIAGLANGVRYLVTFPLADEERADADIAAGLIEDGFLRVVAAGRTWTLPELPPLADGEVYVVVDRLAAGSSGPERIRDSLETAFGKGGGRCCLFVDDGGSYVIDGRLWCRVMFSVRLRCEECGLDFPDLEPRLFSFNSPSGACPTCEGTGIKQTSDGEQVCPACNGARLRPESLTTRVGGRNIAEVSSLKADGAAAFCDQLDLSNSDRHVGRVMIEQIRSRLGYLETVGLGYLPLDRSLRSLSGGEAQRVALTTALGSSLINMLYVLDEPSVGLHPHDTHRLIRTLEALRARGNTVVVVDHDEDVIRAADQVIEIGPAAGERGGRVVFQGTVSQMQDAPASMTGDYLAGRRRIPGSRRRRSPDHGWIRLSGARGNNLRDISVDFPLGLLCLVTGVSGSGKSTLVQDTLYPAVRGRLRKQSPKPAPFEEVLGHGQIDDVVLVDQSPIGRSSRSNPVTYIKAFDEIRAVFAQTLEARTRNYTAGHFSFNVEGGRCETCKGDGQIAIDMQFLPDVYMRCGECDGTRYRREILDARYRDRNIAEVLEMTVREAFIFFRGQPRVQARLKRLLDVGLDYLRLGQPANTLSGGEAQRLKLAAYIASARKDRTLFILDEPTTGLHSYDVVQLIDCFEALLAVGHSLVVVEHNLPLIKYADYLIDLGPGAAEEGGRVVAQGTPEEVSRQPESITGRYLAKALAEELEEQPA